MAARYRLRFFFDYECTPFWSGDEATRARFDYNVDPQELPLAEETRQEINRLSAWFERSLNRDYPPDPGPWRQAECDRFNKAAETLLARCREELGPDFDVRNEFKPLAEQTD
ncbi:MAG: hypothetical protein ACE5GS_00800 [Kiloniellaceae bacterium]